MALASNSIPVAGSLSPGDLSPVREGLSLEGGVGDCAGSSERMPQASTTGMARTATPFFRMDGILCLAICSQEVPFMGVCRLFSALVTVGSKHRSKQVPNALDGRGNCPTWGSKCSWVARAKRPTQSTYAAPAGEEEHWGLAAITPVSRYCGMAKPGPEESHTSR